MKPETTSTQLPTTLLMVLSTTAGLAVASLYYCQPLMALLGQAFATNGSTLGTLPTLTQAGYALGLLLLIPLGDKFDRRQLILLKSLALTIALGLMAVSQGFNLLLLASLVLGVTATLAQDVVPAAATLASPERRGQVVGQVMTGLLSGILLSRVFSGLVGEWLGWRWVYGIAAVAMALVALWLWRVLPHFAATTSMKMSQLYSSMFRLLAQQPQLQLATIAQGLLNAAFSAFWTCLALQLNQHFHLGSSAAGLFGLAGAVGALVAPMVGKMADRLGAEPMVRLGALLTSISFVLMLAGNQLLDDQLYLPVLALLTVTFDMGVQIGLISHQTIIYRCAPQAMSRANAILLAGVFIGMTSGSLLASQLFTLSGWQGVMWLASLLSSLALAIRWWAHLRQPQADEIQIS